MSDLHDDQSSSKEEDSSEDEDMQQQNQSMLSSSSDDEEQEEDADQQSTSSRPALLVADDKVAATSDAAQCEPRSDGNMHVVASHYNELKEAGRQERYKSAIFHMRNFNNWIKSQLISEYLHKIKQSQRVGVPMRVLDMCCGKGGDLLKWERANITYLICTDIAEVSVEQCKARYDMMNARSIYGKKFAAEFIACDSTLVRLRERYKDPSLKLNLVSCQFAFHYSFESLSQADCMVRNAAECLEPGGYFIATIPDAYEIMRRLQQSTNPKGFGNDVYKIDFEIDPHPPPLFGAKYQFHLEGVVDCPEFLVHFPTLVKLCRKHGLKLERKTTFADYYLEKLQIGKQLLKKMSGLESVQPSKWSHSEQFAHLRSLSKGSTASKPVGTLSKSEWEAATLYLTCAFRKCKNTWDTQGKPVFEFD